MEREREEEGDKEKEGGREIKRLREQCVCLFVCCDVIFLSGNNFMKVFFVILVIKVD